MISKRTSVTLTGVVLDEYTELTLDELCLTCRVDQEAIVALVDEGIIEPRVRYESSWIFNGSALPQAVRALRLQRDLDLNPAGVAIALDLLNEIEDLRNRLKIRDIHEDHRHD
jgi:chaperone modulatory protein CbpM